MKKLRGNGYLAEPISAHCMEVQACRKTRSRARTSVEFRLYLLGKYFGGAQVLKNVCITDALGGLVSKETTTIVVVETARITTTGITPVPPTV